MNITFILGNGFDLNLNLYTSYKSFYHYYVRQTYVGEYAESISKMKKELNTFITQDGTSPKDIDSIDWSDLEMGLGKYLNNITSEEEYEAIYYDIRNSLGNYLKLQEQRLTSLPPIDIHSLYQDLTDLEPYLLQVDVPALQNLKQKRGPNRYFVRILTFNYTKVFEHIIGSEKSYDLPGEVNVSVFEVRHIHRLTNQLILGVNDISQISNSSLSRIEFVRDSLIKPLHCATYGDNHSSNCLEYINLADLVVLYGVSLGDTDRKWWKALAVKMRSDNLFSIIVFWYEENAQKYDYDGPRRVRRENTVRNNLMTKMGLSEQEQAAFAARIYVHLIRTDKRIFNFPKLPYSYDVRIAKSDSSG